MPRVSEHSRRISYSRKAAYHLVFCIVKCKRTLFITGWLHLVCVFNCTYNNRHNFLSYLSVLAMLSCICPSNAGHGGSEGIGPAISESSNRVIKLVSNYALGSCYAHKSSKQCGNQKKVGFQRVFISLVIVLNLNRYLVQ